MKKLILLALTLTLAGCSAFQAAPTNTPQPTPIPPTAEVIVATVLVPVEQTVVVTKVVQPTAAPTEVPPTAAPTQAAATATEAAPTQAAPTQAAATATVAAPGAPIALDDSLGAGFFKNMSYSANTFTLRCLVKEVTFKVTAANDAINTVEFYYMIQDKNSIDVSPWINGGNMLLSGGRDFALVFSSEKVDPDWRRPATWFSFQFVGINRLGQRVGGSERFLNLISYTNDCPQ